MYTEIPDEEILEIEHKTDEFEEIISEDVIKELDKLEKTDVDTKSETTEKKKRKKKVVDPLITFVKLYFSSLMARSCKYAVLHLDDVDNKLICLNSRAKISFEDFLLQYTPGDLAVQILTIKDTIAFKMFKDRLHIPDKGLLLLNLNTIRKAISVYQKYKDVDTCPIIFYKSDNDNLYLKYTDITSLDDQGEHPLHIGKFGIMYNDWRTIQILKKIVHKLEHLEECTCIIEDTIKYDDILPYVNQNLLFYPVSTCRFINNNKLIYSQYNEKHNTVLIYIDGRDIVSMKEYIRKKDPESYTLKIIAGIKLPNTEIFYLSTFEDNCVKVICSRPFTSAYPLMLTSKEMTK